MKSKKVLIVSSFLFVILLIVLFVFIVGCWNKMELFPLVHPMIPLDREDRISFYKDGFVISGSETNFFDHKGNTISCPFTINDKVIEDQRVDMITENYILLNGNSIYRTSSQELEIVFTTESSVTNMWEFKDYILFTHIDKDGFIQLNSYDIDNNNINDFDLDANLVYMDFDYIRQNSSLSLLALDTNGPFPTSKIFTFDADLSLFGVVSSIDEVYFRIYRSPSIITLLGSNRIMCYNIDGQVEWDLESNNIETFQTITNDSGFMIYFDSIISENKAPDSFNALFFDEKEKLIYGILPNHLKTIIPFKDKFIANNYDHQLIIINKYLETEKEFSIPNVDSVYWSNYFNNNLYIRTLYGTLEIYSTKQEDPSK